MGEILLGLAIGVVGLALMFMGYRFARVLLSIWGFITGFSLGASWIADGTNTPFLNSLFGIIVGLGVGLLFAALIYAYYYAAVVLLGAATGYWLGSSFIGLFGIDTGFLTAMAGLAVGVLLGFLAVALNVPKAFMIVMTAFAGAIAVVMAVMLVFDVIPNAYLSYQAVRVAINNSFLWWMTAAILGIIGTIAQFTMEREFEIEEWNMMHHGGGTTTQHHLHA